MITVLIILAAIALAAIAALLWYGVRTHKTVVGLERKIVDTIERKLKGG